MARPSFFLTLPFLDTFRGLERCLTRGGWVALVLIFTGLLAGFWIYVPVHELLHALACVAAGGEVTQLEISPLYGGAWLARLFPWVVAGGDYAGRLAGFDTGGHDLVFLATDLGPYLLTLWPGVWLLRQGARRRAALLFGIALPVALAPFISLTGDAYEIGSILVTQVPPWSSEQVREQVRGEDLLKKIPALEAAGAAPGAAPPPWGGVAAAAVVGALWAFATYKLGGLVAHALGYGRVPPARPQPVP